MLEFQGASELHFLRSSCSPHPSVPGTAGLCLRQLGAAGLHVQIYTVYLKRFVAPAAFHILNTKEPKFKTC